MVSLSQRMRQQIQETQARYNKHEDERANRKWHLERLESQGSWRKVDEPYRILNRLKRLAPEVITETLAVAAPPTPLNVLERVIRENNLLGVSFLLEGAQISRTIGRIIVRGQNRQILGFGTGFLISPTLLMTNNHVLQSTVSAATSSVQFNYYETANGIITTPQEFEFAPDTFFFTSEPLDYTVVAVHQQNVNGQERPIVGWNQLIRESGKTIVGEKVNIIQHPGGNPMKVVLHDNRIVDVVDDFLHYEADTEPGSSGAPVYNDQWEVGALHHSGVPKRDDQGNILLRDGSQWDGSNNTIHLIDWIANEGVRISRIIEHLDRQPMTPQEERLYADAFIAPPMPVPIPPETQSDVAPPQPPGNGQPIIEDDGSVSIYYRINIGLANALTPNMTTILPQPPVTSSGIDQPPITASSPADKFRDDARSLVDRGVELTYYDSDQDSENRDQYYDDLNTSQSKAKFFASLHDLLEQTHTTRLKYNTARLKHLYPDVDLHENGKLKNIYSGVDMDPVEVIATELASISRFQEQLLILEVNEQDLDEQEVRDRLLALEAQMKFNCEHVVPQSWFGKEEPMKSDLHHLFACEWGCNSFRGNIAYFDFDPLDEAIRDDCGQVEHNQNRFEPQFGHGIVSRATLYYLLRYPNTLTEHENVMPKNRIKTLISWHKRFKVTRYELHRNARIFDIQGNRNPLIDMPDWVDKIDFNQAF